MQEFDDKLPARKFDNFQFMRADGGGNERSNADDSQISKDIEFALAALMEVPAQYKATENDMSADTCIAAFLYRSAPECSVHYVFRSKSAND